MNSLKHLWDCIGAIVFKDENRNVKVWFFFWGGVLKKVLFGLLVNESHTIMPINKRCLQNQTLQIKKNTFLDFFIAVIYLQFLS